MTENAIPPRNYIIVAQEGDRIVQRSFLVPEDDAQRAFFMEKIDPNQSPQKQLETVKKCGLKLHNAVDAYNLILPAEMEFSMVDGQPRLAEAISYDDGELAPYNDNPYHICAFTFAPERPKPTRGFRNMIQNREFMLDQVGAARPWEEIKFQAPDQEMRKYLLLDNGDMMRHLKHLRPMAHGSFAPVPAPVIKKIASYQGL